MATFPTRESDIVVLAQAIIQGLTTQADTFNKPPYAAQQVKSRTVLAAPSAPFKS